MELTLKQARTLEASLRDLPVGNTTVTVRAYDTEVAHADIQAGIANLDNSLSDAIILNEIRHNIKHMINVANMECGVSGLLNYRDELYSKRELLNKLGKHVTVVRQLDFIRENPSESRLVCVYTEGNKEEVDVDHVGIQNELQGVYGEINDLNNSVTVTLSEEDVDFLKLKGKL